MLAESLPFMSTLKPLLAPQCEGGRRTAPFKSRSQETKAGPVDPSSSTAGAPRSTALESSLERGAPPGNKQHCRTAVRWIAGSTALLLVASHARMVVRVNREAALAGPTGSWPSFLGLQVEEHRLGNASTSMPHSGAGTILTRSHDAGNLNADLPALASKPIMYLDIGPYKTGSTFLQCALARSGYEILQRDNGACDHPWQECAGQHWCGRLLPWLISAGPGSHNSPTRFALTFFQCCTWARARTSVCGR